MNNQRRAEIAELINQLQEIEEKIDALAAEEQEYFDNMPESFQGGDKGMAAESAISALEEASSSVSEAYSQLDEALA